MQVARFRFAHRFLSRTPLRIALFLGLAWLGALPMLAQAGGMNMFHDAQFLSAYERHARWTVLQFGQLPLWDPYSCGGLYGLAAPQTRYTSPLFLLSLALGVDRASALMAVLWPAFAMEGMYRYARSWGSSARVALLCAPLFPLSGFFATAWHVGWVQFYSFCGLPWMLYGLHRALRGSRPGALLLAASCLLTVGFGGTWTLPMGAPLFVMEVLDAIVPGQRRRWFARLGARVRAVLPRLLLAGLLVLSIGAVRLWPMLESAQATLRVMGGEPTPSLEQLWDFVFSLNHGEGHDLGAYYVTPLALASVLALPTRRGLFVWLALATFVVLSLGHITPWAPFALLRQLPVYDAMRYPERFLVLLAIALSLLSARSFSALLAWLRGRFGRRPARAAFAVYLLLFGASLVAQLYNVRAIASDVHLEPTPTLHSDGFRQSRGNRWLMSHFAADGMGSLGCGEAYPLPMSPHLRGDLKREEYVLSDGRADAPGTVERLAWSPNALSLRVHAKRPLRVAINQNYHPGWRADGAEVESWDGLLSLRVPQGEQRVVLRFRPRSGIGGFWVSLVSALGALYWAFAARQKGALAQDRRREALALSAGPLLWLSLILFWPEEPWTAIAPMTPDHSPVYSSHMPEGTKPMHVAFDVPIVIEGTRVSPLRYDEQRKRYVDIDIFMRRKGKLSPNLGIFVFLMSEGRRSEHGDHSVVSGVVYLPRLIEDQRARDAFRVAVPDDAIGSWEVRVGFWNEHGDGERRKVVDASGAKIVEDAVVAGNFEVYE